MPDPLIIDPALQASVIRQFNLRGELSPFLLTNRVVPTFDIGRLTTSIIPTEVVSPGLSTGVLIGLQNTATALATTPPVVEDAEIDGDRTTGPSAGDVLADTGQLAPGVHLIRAGLTYNATTESFDLEWRNAANSASLRTIPFEIEAGDGLIEIEFAGSFLADERIRWTAKTAAAGTASTYIIFPTISIAVAS